MVVGRVADLRQPDLTGRDLLGELLGQRPMGIRPRHVGVPVTGEGELAAWSHLTLIDDAADRLRELRAAHPVQNYLANGNLALNGLAPRLEIDRGGEAAPLARLELGLTLALRLEAETLRRGVVADRLGRRHGPAPERDFGDRRIEAVGLFVAD